MKTSFHLTLQHAKIDAHISVMREPLHRDPQALLSDAESLDEIKAYSARIGHMLDVYVHDQQRALLLEATRILGDSLEEVCAIHELNARLIAQHRRFDELLADVQVAPSQAWLREVRAQFDELNACFERQTDAERAFYALYSTILFPAGAATD